MRLIDADALGIGKCDPYYFDNKGYAHGWNLAIDFLQCAPTVDDAVVVVRCKDCKNWNNGDCYRLELSRPTDFCSYGERKSDNE